MCCQCFSIMKRRSIKLHHRVKHENKTSGKSFLCTVCGKQSASKQIHEVQTGPTIKALQWPFEWWKPIIQKPIIEYSKHLKTGFFAYLNDPFYLELANWILEHWKMEVLCGTIKYKKFVKIFLYKKRSSLGPFFSRKPLKTFKNGEPVPFLNGLSSTIFNKIIFITFLYVLKQSNFGSLVTSGFLMIQPFDYWNIQYEKQKVSC
jgi:hypothetical protein